MHTALRFACMLLLTLRVVGGPLDDLLVNFQTRCDFAEADRDLQMKKLDASYLDALDRLVEKIKASGKLDAVIPLIDEVKAVRAAKDPLPELPAGASLELQQMRAKHAETRAKILKSHAEAITSLAEKMETALRTRETEFTKAGEFDEALAAKKMRESLASDADLARAREQLSTSKPAATTTGAWRSLLAEPMTVVSKDMWDPCILSKIPAEAKVHQPFVDTLKNLGEKPENILMTLTPAAVEFKLSTHATQARGKITLLASQGSIHFKVYAGKKLVFDQIVKDEAKTASFEVVFDATKLIRLESDPMDDVSNDWGAWLAPEIR